MQAWFLILGRGANLFSCMINRAEVGKKEKKKQPCSCLTVLACLGSGTQSDAELSSPAAQATLNLEMKRLQPPNNCNSEVLNSL